MKFLENTTWQHVFAGWREREAHNPGWIECATKIKGWPDWESWRSFTAKQFDAEKQDWKIFEFENPLLEIPEILVGPFLSWQSGVIEKNNTTFKQLLEIPDQYEKFSGHEVIRKIMKGMPFATEFIGIVRKDVQKIVLIDGHHRATAIALAQKQGKNIDFSHTKVSIALTELPGELFDKILNRGTSKKQ